MRNSVININITSGTTISRNGNGIFCSIFGRNITHDESLIMEEDRG